MYHTLPDINDENLEQKMEDILTADAKVCRELGVLLQEMNWAEKMAVGLHAYWLTDTSHKQLCQLQPRHGEFSAEVNEALGLVRQLRPQSLAEVASEILLEEWEDLEPDDDAPSTIIE